MIILARTSYRDDDEELFDLITQKGFGSICKKRKLFGNMGSHQHSRLVYVLHNIVVPNFSEKQLRNELESLQGFIDRRLVWSWISKHEDIWMKIQNYIEAKNYEDIFMDINTYKDYFWTLIENEYENIAHFAIQEDVLQLTILICANNTLNTCDQLNQGNRMEDTPLHVAATSLKLRHLHHLIQAPAIQLSKTNRQGCTALHSLLIEVTMRRGQHTCCTQDLVPIILSMLKRSPELCTIEDNTDRTPLDIALATHDVSLVHTIMSVFVKLPRIDLMRYTTIAVCTNVPGVVDALCRPFITSDNMLSLSASDHANTLLTDILSIAICTMKRRSLHTLLSIKAFSVLINSSNSMGLTPLQVAFSQATVTSTNTISRVCFQGLDESIIRTLLHYKAHPMLPYHQCVNNGTNSNDNTTGFSVTADGDGEVDGDGDGAMLCVPWDNAVAEAVSIGRVDILDLLLSYLPPSRCYIPSLHSSQLNNNNTSSCSSCCYYFGQRKYHYSPIISAVSCNDAISLRKLLESMHFNDIINLQDATGHSAISMACSRGNVSILRILLGAGADVMNYLYHVSGNDMKIINEQEIAVKRNATKLHEVSQQLLAVINERSVSTDEAEAAAERMSHSRRTIVRCEQNTRQALASITKDTLNMISRDISSFSPNLRSFFALLVEALVLFKDVSKSNKTVTICPISWEKALERPSVMIDDMFRVLKIITQDVYHNDGEKEEEQQQEEEDSLSMIFDANESSLSKLREALSMEDKVSTNKQGKGVLPGILTWLKEIQVITSIQMEIIRDSFSKIGCDYAHLISLRHKLVESLHIWLERPRRLLSCNFIPKEMKAYPGFKCDPYHGVDIIGVVRESFLSSRSVALGTPSSTSASASASVSASASAIPHVNGVPCTPSRSDIYSCWWMDAARAGNWDLLKTLLPVACRWDSDESLVQLVNAIVAASGPADLLLDIA
eukprot:gene8452-17424_t